MGRNNVRAEAIIALTGGKEKVYNIQMAKKGLYKFRWKEQRHIAYDIAVMTAGLVMGVLAVTAIFRFAGLMDFGGGGAEDLRGAAPEPRVITAEAPVLADGGGDSNAANSINPEKTAGAATSPYSVTVEAEQYDGYAGVGKKDVSIFKFTLNPSSDAGLRELRFDLDGYASPADVSSMQLYYEGKLAGQAPVYNAKSAFGNLNIQMDANTIHHFEIKANIGEQALSGDRVQIGFKDASGIIARDSLMNTFEAKGEFPLWSGYISIIGKKVT